MREEIVSAEVFAYLDEMQIAPRLLARATRAGFTVADDILRRRDEASLRQRAQRENHAGRIAAGIGDEFRPRNAVRVELRQTVHGVAKMRLVRCGLLVPGGERLRRGEAECPA